MTAPFLEVTDLATSFKTPGGRFRAIEGVSFRLERGRTLGVVGESGCGKSVTAMSLVRLVDSTGGRIETGRVLLDGLDLLGLSPKALRAVRGRRVGMIFQEPMTSLNPVFTIGRQIAEVFTIHLGTSRSEAKQRAIELLRRVRIPAPEQRFDEYPHQLSGGMRQRVMIAIALALKPELVVADEPTTALDVTIQAQILALMAELQTEEGMSILLITHDLGVVAQFCDEVLVMYAGRVVEQGPVAEVFQRPGHPYTRGLLAAKPRLGLHPERLHVIDGVVPALGQFPRGCRFQARCSLVTSQCREAEPELAPHAGVSRAACFNSDKMPTEPQ